MSGPPHSAQRALGHPAQLDPEALDRACDAILRELGEEDPPEPQPAVLEIVDPPRPDGRPEPHLVPKPRRRGPAAWWRAARDFWRAHQAPPPPPRPLPDPTVIAASAAARASNSALLALVAAILSLVACVKSCERQAATVANTEQIARILQRQTEILIATQPIRPADTSKESQ